ncbi:MAG: serine hydrolase domain-containing protein [Parvularculaceae bacterium]
MWRFFAVFAAAVILIAGWLAWPIYGFYAHNGAAGLPPWGWTEAPAGEAPAMQEVASPAYAAAGSAVLAAMAEHRARIGAPAMTASVAIDGEIVWSGAVGWADFERRRPAAVTTVMRIGSTSKAVTAAALARLVDRGVIDLDAPITEYMTDLPNPEWADITPRMLASHMAGVPHYGENTDSIGKYHTGALRAHFDDMREALKIFDSSALLFAPGTDFEYSSLGTVLLGAVMRAAEGKPYVEIVHDEVIAPVGLTSMTISPKTGGRGEFAQFYYREGARYRPWRSVDLSHRLPGGGWAATSADLARLGVKWLDEDFISPATRDAFWTPQRLASGEVNEQNYAIGWRWREYEIDGVGLARNANHGGVSRGAQSWLLVYPDYNMATAFNINAKTDEFRDFGIFYEEIFREFALAIRDARNGIGAHREARPH